MTNFERLAAIILDKKVFAKWLADNVEYEGSPWEEWYTKSYCEHCEAVMIEHEHYHYPVPAAYCEIYEKCRFFPEIDHSPTIEEGIEMWFDKEAEE